MKVDYRFRDMDFSSSLAEHCEDRLDRLENMIMGPVQVHVTFTEGKNKNHRCVEVVIHGKAGTFRASSVSDNFVHAIDKAVQKVGRQLHKKKAKRQRHKRRELSAEGRLERLNDRLESTEAWEYQEYDEAG